MFELKGANIAKAVSLLNSSERVNIHHIRCGGHVINLMVKKILQKNNSRIQSLSFSNTQVSILFYGFGSEVKLKII